MCPQVEVGSDDQTTDGCEGCHMRSATEVDCHRGYEWGLMKEAQTRNPSIVLYGLPWAWAGWLGFGTNSPYANVTATADYTARWIECGRWGGRQHDDHLSISISLALACPILQPDLLKRLSQIGLDAGMRTV